MNKNKLHLEYTVQERRDDNNLEGISSQVEAFNWQQWKFNTGDHIIYIIY